MASSGKVAHCVMFEFKAGTNAADRIEVINTIQGLKKAFPAISALHIGVDARDPAEEDLCGMLSVFDSKEALAEYYPHDKHMEAVEKVVPFFERVHECDFYIPENMDLTACPTGSYIHIEMLQYKEDADDSAKASDPSSHLQSLNAPGVRAAIGGECLVYDKSKIGRDLFGGYHAGNVCMLDSQDSMTRLYSHPDYQRATEDRTAMIEAVKTVAFTPC